MTEQRKRDIIYMQTNCVYLYSKKKRIPLKEAVCIFNRYKIFDFISEFFELLHLYGDEAILREICRRIKEVATDDTKY